MLESFKRRSLIEFLLPTMDFSGSRQKRTHQDVEECDECLPISKRINRLHIEAQRRSQEEGRHELPQQYHEINSFDVNCEPSASWQFGVHSHIDLGDPLVSDRETHLNQHFSGISGCVSSAPYNNTVQPNHSQSILSSNTQGSLHQLRSHIGMTHHSHLLNLHDRSELSLCPEVSAMPANIGQCHQLLPLSPACLVTQHFNELSPDEMIQQPVVSEIEFIIDDDLLQGYNPELRETENPFYFHINQVLFNAHCMRMRRVATHIVPRSNS